MTEEETDYLYNWEKDIQDTIKELVKERIDDLNKVAKGKMTMDAGQMRASELLLKTLLHKVLPDKKSFEMDVLSPTAIWQLLMEAPIPRLKEGKAVKQIEEGEEDGNE